MENGWWDEFGYWIIDAIEGLILLIEIGSEG